MPAKRKLRKISFVDLMEENTVKKVSAKSYPRRWTAVACEVCRIRKTRCDAGKPSCGFCLGIGIDCQYRLPADWDRAKPGSPVASEALQRIEARIASLEEMAEAASQKDEHAIVTQLSPYGQVSPSSQAVYSHGDKTPPASYSDGEPHTPYFHPQPLGAAPRTPSEFSFQQTSGEGAAIQSRTLDLSRKTTRYLQQSFVGNYLRWMPICDIQDCSDYVNEAYACNFEPSSSSSCFTMLVFALGAETEGRIGVIDGELPGLDYFAQGNRMADGMSLMTRSLTTLQCRIMQASYYQFSIRPLQAWNVISQASRDCMRLLPSSLPKILDEDSKEILHRVFWACSILLHELEVVVKMYPIGLRHLHHTIPLPLSRNREEDLDYFLAQTALRKLLMEAREVVGHQRWQVVNAPVVAVELQNQSKEWCHHLHPTLKFPIDARPLLDPRKSFLRIQSYVSMMIGILTYKSPELAFAPETEEYVHTLNGYEILGNWDHLPIIRRGLKRAKRMMIRAGIPVEAVSPVQIEEQPAPVFQT
ncbi:hypothetical protein BJ878DRAFT_542755 [Calycina marina]|uniref:Zn(2)-C6 fungal-type domain-containing protein n=1 Tax=Calycina marina TaxID=1763456 RepID=A0A9P8CEC1_9HELO|nr:hypothetical protein BJ878DRAFT_542755 [Calycina marina]